MRAIPFFIVLFILVTGAATALQTLNAPSEVAGTPTERPTNTPRPRPTSPRAEAATATAEALAEAATATAQAQAAAAARPPTPVATQPPPSSTPTPLATPGRPGLPTPTPLPQNVLRVGNTGGEGVYIRRTPNMNDRIRPWMDGSPMVPIGPKVAGDGKMWQRVRAPDGVEGYIPVEYLVGGPPEPTATPNP